MVLTKSIIWNFNIYLSLPDPEVIKVKSKQSLQNQPERLGGKMTTIMYVFMFSLAAPCLRFGSVYFGFVHRVLCQISVKCPGCFGPLRLCRPVVSAEASVDIWAQVIATRYSKVGYRKDVPIGIWAQEVPYDDQEDTTTSCFSERDKSWFVLPYPLSKTSHIV